MRRDILLSESSGTTAEYDSSSINNLNKNKSAIDMIGAITLSITVISFLVALQFIQTVNEPDSPNALIVIGFGAGSNYCSVIFYYDREEGTFSINRSK